MRHRAKQAAIYSAYACVSALQTPRTRTTHGADEEGQPRTQTTEAHAVDPSQRDDGGAEERAHDLDHAHQAVDASVVSGGRHLRRRAGFQHAQHEDAQSRSQRVDDQRCYGVSGERDAAGLLTGNDHGQSDLRAEEVRSCLRALMNAREQAKTCRYQDRHQCHADERFHREQKGCLRDLDGVSLGHILQQDVQAGLGEARDEEDGETRLKLRLWLSN